MVAGEQHHDFGVDLDLAARRALAAIQDAEAPDQRHRFEPADALG
ncbi:hypothetical protein SEHO0A_pSEHO0A1p05744 (plasmid) [Salmonella enterica subsp. houtenae str. ATCC BAA-1581]|nr:hypothetical protein SEHO0A_pSEHO0A1p05744 [Salmonella enterica subsp. houtenae str. ATCC BAA-1581]